jgi:hypothetical protein
MYLHLCAIFYFSLNLPKKCSNNYLTITYYYIHDINNNNNNNNINVLLLKHLQVSNRSSKKLK